ncbi:MAG TPA: Uma2 family endonuclease [Polyangiaceae bacterium]
MTLPFEHPRPPPSSATLVCDDGEPMESARHRQQMTVLIESLEHAWRERSDFYVGGNMFLYFSEVQARNNDFRGPDVFVVTDTTRRERRAWVVWEEDGRAPDVIIELLSPKTEAVDRGEKMRIYARSLKVGEYFLYDPFSHVFEGYDLDLRRQVYVPKAPLASGQLCCEQLGLLLGKARGTLYAVTTEWLRWFDAEGRLLPMPSEQANAEQVRADTAEQRADEEARRADEEGRRADEEARRADEEARRADEEARRAEETRVRLDHALAELERLERPTRRD